MKTLAQLFAGVVALMCPAMAEEKAIRPVVVTAGAEAHVDFRGKHAGEVREYEIASGVKVKFVWCPPGDFMMGSPKSEQGRDSRDEDQAKVTLS